MAGIYIHIPFCKSRCIYCDFYSTTADKLQDRYVDALCREMLLRKDYLATGSHIDTIYIGGGTPSQLSANNLKKLFNGIGEAYQIKDYSDKEITLECNPDDVNPDFINIIKSLPINRISMGAQTFDDKRLRFLRRRHTSRQIYEAVELLRQAVSNISIDLMFGFPDETTDEWKQDLKEAIALNVQHISAYSLMYEQNTPLYSMLKQGKIKEIDEQLSLEMYDTLIDLLTNAGYEHYEISNFTKPNCRSKHNSSYWKATPYIGIGAAAHSYNIMSRQWNVANINKYIDEIEAGNVPMTYEELDDNTKYNDLITTALRTSDGINIASLQPFYRDYLMESAKQSIENGLIEIKNGALRLTRRGLYISDNIMSELIKI